jgi:dephospho-CoA kinase
MKRTPRPPQESSPGSAGNGPFLVGVTGLIGSGKSLLCRILAEEHGSPVIDADRLGHEAIAPGGAARDALVARLGEAVLDSEGEIDRSRLARLVFADVEALAVLESQSHPVILAEVERRVTALKASGYTGIILLDAAVLPAWLHLLRLGALVLVHASLEVRLQRLEARGLDREEARRRNAVQERLFSEVFTVDRMVDNDGTRESLERAAGALWRELVARFGAPERS